MICKILHILVCWDPIFEFQCSIELDVCVLSEDFYQHNFFSPERWLCDIISLIINTTFQTNLHSIHVE